MDTIIRLLKQIRSCFVRAALKAQLRRIVMRYTQAVYGELQELSALSELTDRELTNQFVPIPIEEYQLLEGYGLGVEFAKLMNRVTSLDFTSFSRDSSVFLVLGEARSGKTALLVQWASSLLARPANHPDEAIIPMFLSWNEIDQRRKRLLQKDSVSSTPDIHDSYTARFDLKDYLRWVLEERGVTKLARAFLDDRLEKGRCTIFLDGLDAGSFKDCLTWLSTHVESLVTKGNKIVFGLQVSSLGNELYSLIDMALAGAKTVSSALQLFVHIWLAAATEYSFQVYNEFRELQILDMKTYFDWDRQFVPLKAREYIPRRGFVEKADFDAYVQTKSIVDPAVILAAASTTVILGDAGSGKTTLLTKWMLSLLKEPEKIMRQDSLPFFIPIARLEELLDRIAHSRLGDSVLEKTSTHLGEFELIDCLQLILEDYGITKYTRSFLQSWLGRGSCVIFLDGLDEISDETPYMHYKEWLAKQIRKLTRAQKGNRVLLTSRVSAFREGLFHHLPYHALEISEFDSQDIERFVEAWFAGTNESEKGEALLKILGENKRLREIADNPLLLSVMAITYQQGWSPLPNRRVLLYDYCVQILLYRWDEERGLRRSLYEYPLKRAVLERLALALHCDHKRVFTRSYMRSKIEKACTHPRVRLQKHQVDSMMEELLKYSGMLRQMAYDRFGFRHMALQEFLTASAIVEDYELEMLVENAFESWWHEVIVLAAGILDDATDLLEDLLEECQEVMIASGWITILLGRCLKEAQQVTNEDILDRIYTSLIELARPWEV